MQEAELDGYGTYPAFIGEPDNDIVAMYDQLVKDTSFVRRNAAVPTIAAPVPFDAAVLLDRIRTHVSTWTSKQLLDPAFAAQLDRYMAAAADAYRRNQPKVGKEHIETLRKMLKKEQPDADKEDGKDGSGEDDKTMRTMIGKLAARVLDFDLKYVLKRVDKD